MVLKLGKNLGVVILGGSSQCDGFLSAGHLCATCQECQLVKPSATQKAPLRPLPLIKVPFERIGMDFVVPLVWTAHGHRFVLVFRTWTMQRNTLKALPSQYVA